MVVNKTINQHYVQQAYLKNFSSDRKTLFRYNKITKSSYPNKKNIEYLCAEDEFYDFDFNKDDFNKMISLLKSVGKNDLIDNSLVEFINSEYFNEQYIEKELFANLVENKFFSSIKLILDRFTEIDCQDYSNTILLDSKNSVYLAFYIVFQYRRTKKIRNQIIDVQKQINKFLNEGNIDKFLKDETYVAKQTQQSMLLDTEEIVKDVIHLLNRNFHVCVNQSNTPFYTSDCPVILFNPLNELAGIKLKQGFSVNGNELTNGFCIPQTDIFFPISPKLLVVYSNTLTYGEKSEVNKFVIKKYKFIELCNCLQLRSANKLLFSDENSFN